MRLDHQVDLARSQVKLIEPPEMEAYKQTAEDRQSNANGDFRQRGPELNDSHDPLSEYRSDEGGPQGSSNASELSALSNPPAKWASATARLEDRGHSVTQVSHSPLRVRKSGGKNSVVLPNSVKYVHGPSCQYFDL